jgi:chromo domain-containing protein 1
MNSINCVPVEAEHINDPDEIGTNTTLSADEGSDEEWLAEAIIAEGKINRQTRYLVEWTGFAIKDATWEPLSHVRGSLMASWSDQKKLQREGKAEKFDLSIWTAAWVDELRAKYERHERRNERRIQAGKPTVTWDLTLDERIQQTADFYPSSESRDDELSEDDDSLWERLDRPSGATPAAQRQSPTTRALAPEVAQPTTQAKASQRSQGRSDEGRTPSAEKPGNSLNPPAASRPTTATPSHSSATIRKGPVVQSSQGKGLRQMLAGSKAAKNKTSATKSGGANKVLSIPVTAKKSGAVPANVFLDGKKQKPRPNLYDASSDTTKAPQILNLSKRWKLEVQRRDKENDAPSQMPKSLISLDPKQKPAAITIPDGTASVDGRAARIPLDETMPMDIDNDVPSKPKKTKSVRFNDDVSYLEPAASTHDLAEASPEPDGAPHVQGSTNREPDLFFNETDDSMTCQDELARPPTPPRAQSRLPNQPDVHLPSTGLQDITKTCRMGPQGRLMSFVFKKVPQNSHPWLSHFKSCNEIVFSHVCSAHDFAKLCRVGEQVRQQDIASGFISCPTESIEHIVDRLKLNSHGILSAAESYHILCFPTRCDEWDPVVGRSADGEGLSLGFIVFEPAGDMRSFFAPDPQRTVDKDLQNEDALVSRGLQKFMSLNYTRLIPRTMQDSKEHRFFLAFPAVDTYADEMQFIAQWLNSASTASCRIYSALTHGAWHDFVSSGRSSNGGIVILHEDTLWHVRRFPDMFKVLESGKFLVYMFTRGLDEYRLFPSAHHTLGKPAILNLDQVLRSERKAFMLTPSFILSEPRNAALFMKWFRKNHGQEERIGLSGRLVVWANFTDWLLDLMYNQTRSPSRQPFRGEVDSWDQFLSDFVNLPGDNDCIVIAPSSIDGNDEQSLVNWFGYWSLKHMDETGLCHVLGSCPHDHRSNAMTTRIGGLRFVEGTVEDPVFAEDDPDAPEDGDGTSRPAHGALRVIRDDSYEEIASFLSHFTCDLRGGNSLITIFNQPLSYWDYDIGLALGDRSYSFKGYKEWHRFVSNFGFKRGMNTYAALFYTIEDDWTGQDLPPSTKRRPWLAFIRPLNPHLNPYRESELLIWDPSYRGKFNARNPVPEESLIDAQRQLMLLLSQQPVDSKAPLQAVRLAWNDMTNLVSPDLHPLDQCLEMLENCRGKLRTVLPAPQHAMLDRGWALVTPYDPNRPKHQGGQGGQDQPLESPGRENSSEAMDIDLDHDPHDLHDLHDLDDMDNEDSLADLRIVFHPPRSPLQPPPGNRPTSYCHNMLFKRLRQETTGSDGKPAKNESFTYTFPSTMEWYGQQVKEGRDFKHMMVAPYYKVFQHIGL